MPSSRSAQSISEVTGGVGDGVGTGWLQAGFHGGEVPSTSAYAVHQLLTPGLHQGVLHEPKR
jgi:hypothetical protein